MVLLIDNYDSFTYNIYQLISSLGFEVTVKYNDEITIEEIAQLQPSHVVISPGPGRPEDSGVSLAVIKKFYKTIPILGLCLGHQCIGQVFGSKIVRLKRPVHGKTSEIRHFKTGLLKNTPTPFIAARYHSLALESVPVNFKLSAETDDGTIMGIEHENYPLYGIQFHPESFMSEQGANIVRNFLK